MLFETVIGSITGLFGSAMTSYFRHKTKKLELEQKKLEYDFELKRIEKETEAMIKETEANIQLTNTLVEGQIELADSEVYKENQKLANKPALSERMIEKLFSIDNKFLSPIGYFFGTVLVVCLGFIEVLRQVMRPGLTAYLLGLSTWLSYKSYTILQSVSSGITAVQAFDIFQAAIQTVWYLTIAAVSWWFADRFVEKTLFKKLDKK